MSNEKELDGWSEKQDAGRIGQIGSADVKNFRRTWEDCEEIMNHLGFKLQGQAKAEG